jgi:chaperonin cofactor prefoldin
LQSLAQLEKLRKDAEDCERIGKLAIDPKKHELFERLAAHLKVLATEVERVMRQSRK